MGASFIVYDRSSAGSSYNGVVFKSTAVLLLFVRFVSFVADADDVDVLLSACFCCCCCFSLNSCANFDGDLICIRGNDDFSSFLFVCCC